MRKRISFTIVDHSSTLCADEVAKACKERQGMLERILAGEKRYDGVLGWYHPESFASDGRIDRILRLSRGLQEQVDTLVVIGVGGFRGGADVRGVIFGLGAAAFYAAVILLNKFIRSVAGIQRTFLQFLAAIVILIPYVAATGGVSLGTLDACGWVCLLIVGFFHTGVTYCLYFSALRELPGQEVALLSYMDPLVAVIVSVTVLGEPVTAPQLVGGALILGFTLWNELPEKK